MRDTLYLHALAKYQVLTLKQLLEVVVDYMYILSVQGNPIAQQYKQLSLNNLGNRIRTLTDYGWVISNYIPLNQNETQARNHSTLCVRLNPKAFKDIGSAHEQVGRLSDWESIVTLVESLGVSKKMGLSQQSLDHDTQISRVLIEDTIHSRKNADRKLIFAIRTHPTHPDVSRSFKIKKEFKEYGNSQISIKEVKGTVNPDIFRCVFNERSLRYEFLKIEVDNDSNDDFIQKLDSYIVFIKRNYFENTVRMFAKLYGLRMTEEDIKKASFKVLVIVRSRSPTNPLRRIHKLLETTLFYSDDDTLFNLVTMQDFRTNPYGDNTLNQATFKPLMKEYLDRHSSQTPHMLRKWLDSEIPKLRKARSVL